MKGKGNFQICPQKVNIEIRNPCTLPVFMPPPPPTSVCFSCTAGKVGVRASASMAWICVYPEGPKYNNKNTEANFCVMKSGFFPYMDHCCLQMKHD